MSTPSYVTGTTRLPEFVIPTSNEDIQNEALTVAQEEFVHCLLDVIRSNPGLRKQLGESGGLECAEESGPFVLVLPRMSQWGMFIAEAVIRECFTSLTSFLVGQGLDSRIVICHEDLIQRKIMQDALATLQLDVEKETKGTIDTPTNGVGQGEVHKDSKETVEISKSVGEKPKSETTLLMDPKFVAIKILDKPSSSDLEVVRSFQPEPDSVWTNLSHLHILDILYATGPVYIMKPDWTSFGVGSDISLPWDSPDMEHALELFDFPSTFAEVDIIKIFKDFEETGFVINWTDDTHAVIRFASKEIATQALSSVRHPSLKCRPVSVASRKTKLMLARSPDRRLPYKRRPQTESKTAKRLILSSLGIRREGN